MAGGSRESGPRSGICPVIVGATAVGKTSLMLQLAAEFPIEVISLDSRQLYHGLRIGTAQPTPAEQVACRHHLVDFLPPTQTSSAQRFREDFCTCWTEITSRGRLPLLVGGAGLYLRAVDEGFFELPPGSEERLVAIRAAIAGLSDAELATALSPADPAAAVRLHPNDRYRRQRALEVCRLAGRTASELAAAQQPSPALGLSYPVVRLERPVAELETRIRARTAAMLDAGWIEETQDLLTRHPADCPGLQSLGYVDIVRYLGGELAQADLAPAIVLATRQYAKRQRTWFRRVDAVIASRPEEPGVLEALRRLVRQGLEAL